MYTIRHEKVMAAYYRAYALLDQSIYNGNNVDEAYEFLPQIILADESLTEDEKSEVITLLNIDYDSNKILFNEGKKRICESCQEECLATLYCEYCIRNYLKAKFLNWTSGNNDIDNLIQKCQMGSNRPRGIIEWIPYNHLHDVKYLTKGGCSEIYTADWIGGPYYEWNPEEQLIRFGNLKVILKMLENVESANRSWFEEAKSHLTISNKWANIVPCYGLTQNPSNGDYMLVMRQLDIDLRKCLQQNHNQLTWKERTKITDNITDALERIHCENAIHRDLHSGNILYLQYNNYWFISDLGFCGPADNPLGSIYGNLPYIAPEVIVGKQHTFASDMYGFAMLMWEISSGQPPFINFEYDYDLAMNIVNGMRPKIVPGTPSKYRELMEQCWDADPIKRPSIQTFRGKIKEINKSYHQNKNEEQVFHNQESGDLHNLQSNSTNFMSKVHTSKVYKFENFPEPKNAIEGEQEAFHSKVYSFNIPENIDDFNKSSSQNNNSTSKTNDIFKDISKNLSKVFKTLKMNSIQKTKLRMIKKETVQ